MKKRSWIRGQYYFGDSEMESSLADAETDTKALLPHPQENTRRPKFWKSFLGIKDKMLDVGLANTEESSISEYEYIANPRRQRSRLLFWRRTHMLLKEVPSMDSSLSSLSNFHSKALPLLEHHNMAFNVSHKSVLSSKAKVSYNHKGSIAQFSPRLRRGAQDSATSLTRLTRRREELWLLLAPSSGSLQPASPNRPPMALSSCSPPDLTRWKWQPLEVKKPEVESSTPLLGLNSSVVAKSALSQRRIDNLKAESILMTFPTWDNYKVQDLQAHPMLASYENSKQVNGSPKRANHVAPLSRQRSLSSVAADAIANGESTSDAWSPERPYQPLLEESPSHPRSPLVALLPENWSPNWAAFSAPVLTAPPTANVKMVRSEPPRYHRKPERNLSIAIPAEARPVPHAACRVDIERGEMDPNWHNRLVYVEEINPYHVHGALPIQYLSSNSVDGSKGGLLTGRNLFSFPAKPIVSSEATGSADSVEGLVSVDSLATSCSDSHDHSTIAAVRVMSYRYMQHLNFLHTIVAQEGNEAKLLKYLN